MKHQDTSATKFGPKLLAALERLLAFPQNQDSTDPKLHAAIRQGQTLVNKIRGPNRWPASGVP